MYWLFGSEPLVNTGGEYKKLESISSSDKKDYTNPEEISKLNILDLFELPENKGKTYSFELGRPWIWLLNKEEGLRIINLETKVSIECYGSYNNETEIKLMMTNGATIGFKLEKITNNILMIDYSTNKYVTTGGKWI